MSKKRKNWLQKGLALVLATAMAMGGAAATYPYPTASKVLAADITLSKASGYEEGAYVEWTPVEGADGYIVYVSADSGETWTEIDDELIRRYPGYFRADALGLKAGKYLLKVEAATFTESLVKAETVAEKVTDELTVISHDRSGFAFSTNSPLKSASGAYNEDGTLKEGAQVIYVTADTAKTVTADIHVDGTGKAAKTQTGLQTILDAKQKSGTSDDILDIRVIGKVSKSDLDHISSSAEGLQIKGNKAQTNMNITIEGVGEDATIHGFGFLIRNCGNVEFRNFAVMAYMDDGVSIDTDNCNLWMHNLDFFYGSTGSDSDQAKGDGSLDIKKSQYCTVSYNHFWDSGKSNLIDASSGTSSNDSNYLTYHHNWYDHSDSRCPRVRHASAVHIYNNYYDSVAKYGVGSTTSSSTFVEANYFYNTAVPMMISMQGTDAKGAGTFSKEDGGIIKVYNNKIVGATDLVYQNASSGLFEADATEFDAYYAAARDEQVPADVKAKQGGGTYSNFDTDAGIDLHAEKVDDPEQVEAVVTAKAGRLSGGDFDYDFEAQSYVQDKVPVTAAAYYGVDTYFKSLTVNYVSSLISVGGKAGGSAQVEKCTVTYDPGNGDAAWSEEVEQGAKLTEPATPANAPEGKPVFGGWYNGNTKWHFSTAVTGNITLTGKWYAEGESQDPGQTEEPGESTRYSLDCTKIASGDITENTTKDGFTIHAASGGGGADQASPKYYWTANGSYLGTNGVLLTDTTIPGNADGLLKSIEFTAEGEGTLTVEFSSSSKDAAKLVLAKMVDGTLTTVDSVEVSGTSKTSKSFTIAAAGTYYLYADPAKNKGLRYYSLKLTQKEVAAATYAVTFQTNGGTAVAAQTVESGKKAEKPADPAKDDFVFDGWYTDEALTSAYDFESAVTADITLYAKWTARGVDPGNGTVHGDDEIGLHVELKNPGEEYVYTGKAIQPEIIVTNNGDTLMEGVDYTVKYANNIKVSTAKKATITVIGKGSLTGKQSTTFEIKEKSLKELDVPEELYVASGAKAAPILIYNGMRLSTKDYIGADLTKKYTADGTLKIKGAGNYTDTIEMAVTVVPKDQLKKFKAELTGWNFEYTGEERKASVKVTDAATGAELEESDYTIVWPEDVINAGKVKFYVIGRKYYTGCVKAMSDTISPMNIGGIYDTVELEGVADEYPYDPDGVTVDRDLTVKVNGRILSEGKDYKITYKNNKKVGIASYSVIFRGNYRGETGADFSIKSASLAELEASGALKAVALDKTAKKAGVYKSVPYVSVNNIAVKKSDLSISYYLDASLESYTQMSKSNPASPTAEEPATVYVQIAGTGNYSIEDKDSVVITYKVYPAAADKSKDLSRAKLVAEDGKKLAKQEYTGREVEPEIAVKIGSVTVPGGEDGAYDVHYFNNVKKGKATVIVTAKEGSGYTGGKAATFSIASKNLKNSPDLLKDLMKALGL